MPADPTTVVAEHISAFDGENPDLTRIVATPSGLDAAGMMEALNDPRLTEPGRQPIALQMMCDWMAPEGSIYFDSIYGDNRGQSAIRNWLLPVMATIDFIEFVPTGDGVLFDDGQGGTSLDEWQMFVNLDDLHLPLSRGVSVRRYREGWITWSCDVYDTGPFRLPPPPGADVDVEAEPLPDWPRTVWEREAGRADIVMSERDPDVAADRFHPTDSVYHDPRAGELHGRDAIRDWMRDALPATAGSVFEPLGPRLDDGNTAIQEWQQMRVGAGGSRSFVTRGTSVRRSVDGVVTYAADYYDTASIDGGATAT